MFENLGTLTEFINIIVMAATAVWAVSKIRGTTERLAITMEHLRSTVQRLDLRFEHITRDLSTLRERMSIMETKQAMQSTEISKVKENQ